MESKGFDIVVTDGRGKEKKMYFSFSEEKEAELLKVHGISLGEEVFKFALSELLMVLREDFGVFVTFVQRK